MIETKFQMYLQKIYKFIKFRSLYTEYFQFKNGKIYIYFFGGNFDFCAFLVLQKDHTYLQMLSF